MDVVVCRSASEAADLVARLIAERLRGRPATVLGLATGRTMEDMYTALVARGASFAGCRTFNLDEYVGLAPDDPRSYAHYMRRHLFERVDIDPARTHLPDGTASDPAAAAAGFERRIAAAGGIDLQLLGIGRSGHIGFNEPLSAFASRTRAVTLAPETRAQNAEMFGGEVESVPLRAITMGVGTILEARATLLLACGTRKAEMVARAVEGPLTASISASALQWHPRCTVVLDAAAAAELENRALYDHAVRCDPAWVPYL